MSRRNKIIITTLLALLTLGIMLLPFMSEDPTEVPVYSLGKITRGSLKAEVTTTGTLSPVITVQVGSQVSGTIQHLYADFNSEVKKGQVIAQIDPAIFTARLAEADANVRSSQAASDKAQIIAQEAKKSLARVTDLFNKQLASDSELDDARAAHKTAVAEYQLKEAAKAQAQAARKREQVNLDYTTIIAPIDGIVISRDVDVGQTVAASLQAPTLFTIAHNLTQMQIETEVDEAFIGMVKAQQPVTFSVFAYQNQEFSGHVSQVRLQPKVEAGVVKYNCIIKVDNTDLALKPGMTATVSIEVAHKENVFKVPNAALRYVPDLPTNRLKKLRDTLKSNEAVLWLPQDNGFTPITVKLGIVGERETEVIANNLEENMTVVLPPKNKDATQSRRFGLKLF